MKTKHFPPLPMLASAIVALIAALNVVAVRPAAGQTESAVVTRIVDGDTIEATVGGVPLTIRYIGVDTPESKKPNTPVQCYALEATEANRALVLGQTITLERDRTNYDRYGRLLRYVYLADGRMVNEELVKLGAGFAKRYRPDTKHAVRLEAAQALAQAAKAGLWGACTVVNGATQPLPGGGAVAPVIGATRQPPPPAASGSGAAAPIDPYNCPASHPIKGNRNSMIYHKPGQQAYTKTKPEQCFASDADAVAAGYRAAKR
jgi:micrococcal nuclease